MRIELVIDTLVLHGFDARDRHHIADAIVAGLTSRLTGMDPGALANGTPDRAVLYAVECRPRQTVAGVTPATIGDAVAGSIARGIGGGE